MRSALTSRIRTTLLLDWLPLMISTDERGMFSSSAKKRTSASLACPSTGGAVREIFNAALSPTPSTPEIAVRLARGCTRTAKLTPDGDSFREIMRVSVLCQKWPCQCAPAWSLPQSQSRNRRTCPWKAHRNQAADAGWPTGRAVYGASGSRSALFGVLVERSDGHQSTRGQVMQAGQALQQF